MLSKVVYSAVDEENKENYIEEKWNDQIKVKMVRCIQHLCALFNMTILWLLWEHKYNMSYKVNKMAKSELKNFKCVVEIFGLSIDFRSNRQTEDLQQHT